MVDVMMASPACVNTAAAMPSLATAPEAFPSFGWLSPRISFSVDDASASEQRPPPVKKPDPEFLDFEFRLGEDPVAMLPADELFSDGKLVPLHLATPRPPPAVEMRSPEAIRPRRRLEMSASELYAESPRAPRCASRWRELLGLRRQPSTPRLEVHVKTAAVAGKSPAPKPLKQLLHRNARSDASQSLPLLRDSDSEPASISSRRSLSSSSSSSGQDYDDLPRLSLDSEKPAIRNPPRMRASRARRPPTESAAADSPRMNASGRVVFQGLERSSSSPGSFNGGPRPRPRGMARSYSANLRVTPVLNVPVCSLRGSVFGFGQFFSSPSLKRDGAGGGAASRSHSGNGNGSSNGIVKLNSDRAPPRDLFVKKE